MSTSSFNSSILSLVEKEWGGGVSNHILPHPPPPPALSLCLINNPELATLAFLRSSDPPCSGLLSPPSGSQDMAAWATTSLAHRPLCEAQQPDASFSQLFLSDSCFFSEPLLPAVAVDPWFMRGNLRVRLATVCDSVKQMSSEAGEAASSGGSLRLTCAGCPPVGRRWGTLAATVVSSPRRWWLCTLRWSWAGRGGLAQSRTGLWGWLRTSPLRTQEEWTKSTETWLHLLQNNVRAEQL